MGGWLLILAGESLRVWSVGYAGATTRSMKLRAERLVTGGPYGRTRNPIYLGNFLLGLGFCFLAGVWWVLPLYLLYFGIQYSAIISLEEGFLREKFGGEYEAYSVRVPRFFPRLSGFLSGGGSGPLSVRFNHRNLSGEYWTILGILAMGAVLETLKFFPVV